MTLAVDYRKAIVKDSKWKDQVTENNSLIIGRINQKNTKLKFGCQFIKKYTLIYHLRKQPLVL